MYGVIGGYERNTYGVLATPARWLSNLMTGGHAPHQTRSFVATAIGSNYVSAADLGRLIAWDDTPEKISVLYVKNNALEYGEWGIGESKLERVHELSRSTNVIAGVLLTQHGTTYVWWYERDRSMVRGAKLIGGMWSATGEYSLGPIADLTWPHPVIAASDEGQFTCLLMCLDGRIVRYRVPSAGEPDVSTVQRDVIWGEARDPVYERPLNLKTISVSGRTYAFLIVSDRKGVCHVLVSTPL